MAAGLQIWDSSGVMICDTSSSLFNYLGQVNIGGDSANSGSITDAKLNPINAGLGRFTYFLILTGTQSSPLNTPSVSLSGTTITWTWPNNDPKFNNLNDKYILIYGMY